MLCMHRAQLAGSQKRLQEPHPGDEALGIQVRELNHTENNNPAVGNGAMPLLATLKLDLLHSRELGKGY